MVCHFLHMKIVIEYSLVLEGLRYVLTPHIIQKLNEISNNLWTPKYQYWSLKGTRSFHKNKYFIGYCRIEFLYFKNLISGKVFNILFSLTKLSKLFCFLNLLSFLSETSSNHKLKICFQFQTKFNSVDS